AAFPRSSPLVTLGRRRRRPAPGRASVGGSALGWQPEANRRGSRLAAGGAAGLSGPWRGPARSPPPPRGGQGCYRLPLRFLIRGGAGAGCADERRARERALAAERRRSPHGWVWWLSGSVCRSTEY